METVHPKPDAKASVQGSRAPKVVHGKSGPRNELVKQKTLYQNGAGFFVYFF